VPVGTPSDLYGLQCSAANNLVRHVKFELLFKLQLVDGVAEQLVRPAGAWLVV